MDNENLNECFFYLGINLSLFLIKNLFSYFLNKNLLNNKKEENKNIKPEDNKEIEENKGVK
jgi:hypothetical protein